MRGSLLITAMAIAIFCSCNSNYESDALSEYAAAADSTQFSHDISSLNSPSRKRIRTADVRCRVTDVFATTSRMEQLTQSLDGIVVESTLSNESIRYHEFPCGADSVKKIQLYTPVSNLTLRVPSVFLDSVTVTLTRMADFIERRKRKDTDATLNYLSNALKNNVETTSSVNIRENNKKPLEVAVHQEEKQEKQIDRKIPNLKILDEVAYSTLTVQLFQAEKSDVQVVVSPTHITRAGFGTELASAFRSGGTSLRNFTLIVLQIWPFWLALAGGWLLYRKLSGKRAWMKLPAKKPGA